jgi:PDZ domain
MEAMSNKAIYLAIGLVAGAVASAWFLRSPERQSPRETLSDTQTGSVDDRFIELQNSIAEQLGSVRDEIDSLRSELESLSATPGEPDAAPLRSRPDPANPGDARAINAELERARILALEQKGRIEALVEAGFSRARAEELERRIDEHRVAAMQARYESARRGDSPPLGNAEIDELFNADSMLRSELGDADFERYLTAMGRPTDITVMSVLSSSAAQQAGMQAGDRIVSYDGHRVFDMRELVELPLQGEPGASVMVDIVRDGQAMQLVLPRGPLGIMGSVGPFVQVAPAERE